jgi:aspartyl protease family protein
MGWQARTLRLGESPASLGERGQASSGRISLPADGGGHFMGSGSINGRPVQFMVDTGRLHRGDQRGDAERIGLAYRAASP